MPANLLTKNTVQKAVKVDANSPVNVNGKVAEGKESKDAKGVFASMFEGLLGNAETKVEDKSENTTEGKSENSKGPVAEATKPEVSAETKLDALLKNKELEKNQKSQLGALSTEKALPAEVLKNINNLIDKTPVVDVKGEAVVGDKVAATSSNLDQLLKSLKSQNTEVETSKDVDADLNAPQVKKAATPLDFLLKQSKESDVGSVDVREDKLLQTNPDAVSKLGLSSEDFLSHMSGAKESREAKNAKNPANSEKMMNLDGEAFDPQALVQKQMNQSMKSYGQKQNLLNDNVIRSPKDLASKETKLKSSIDELKSPDMKVGAELAGIKEQFIPVMQRQEQGSNTATQGSEKVLDLSKINTSNSNEIIKKISDYIQQGQVANKDSLDLTVKHDSLGQFKIQVNRPVGNGTQMDMQITTSTAEGHDFFMKNEIGLMKNLSQAGIQLSDLRIVSESGSSTFAGNDSRQSGNSQNGAQAGREFMSFEASGDSSNGSDRRKELWQEARNNQQRYGA